MTLDNYDWEDSWFREAYEFAMELINKSEKAAKRKEESEVMEKRYQEFMESATEEQDKFFEDYISYTNSVDGDLQMAMFFAGIKFAKDFDEMMNL